MTVDNYKHPSAKRRMIPTAEQQAWADDKDVGPRKIIYPRNTDLDPQLVWRGKDTEDQADLVIEAPPIYIQEKIHSRVLIERLQRETASKRFSDSSQLDFHSDFNGRPEGSAKAEFYQHDQNWSNRMILGDSLLVMASLREREALKGQVQCIYFDPPYGIKFNSNWQAKTSTRDVRDGKIEDRTREPEMIRAFRDTWRDGVHSYLSYLRDRLLCMRDLLHPSGSIFVQIGDENVHVVRSLLDEVFGPENFVVTIVAKKKGSQVSGALDAVNDHILWYGASPRDSGLLKIRQLFESSSDEELLDEYNLVEFESGERLSIVELEKRDRVTYRANVRAFRARYPTARAFALNPLKSGGFRKNQSLPFAFQGRTFPIGPNQCWKHTVQDPDGGTSGMDRLGMAGRLYPLQTDVRFVRYAPEPLIKRLSNWWDGLGGASAPVYVVQTNPELIKRCILMTTDPGDLVLDPTCGSGTTAFVGEQWARRWITIDTSRVALTLARARLMGARFPYYLLMDSEEGNRAENDFLPAEKRRLPPSAFGKDIRQGFVYQRAAWTTSGSIANNEQIDVLHQKHAPLIDGALERLNASCGKAWLEHNVPRIAPEDWSEVAIEHHREFWETVAERKKEMDAAIAQNAEVELLFDRPLEDRKRIRVAGPFTVDSLSPHRVIPAGEDDPFLDESLEERSNVRFMSADETDFERVVVAHLKRVGVHNGKKNETIRFESLSPRAGEGWVSYEGRFDDAVSRPRRAAIAIGPEYDAVGRDFMVKAQKEALRGLYDLLVVCGFQFAPETDETRFDTRELVVLKARMNQDIRMGNRLKDTGADKLFVVFGEPDIEVRNSDGGKFEIELKGVDIFDPTTGELRSSASPSDDVACWFIDDDYDEESFFVKHAYFLNGKESDPYAALRRALSAEIDEDVWETLRSTVSRPFIAPQSGKVCVKVINYFGDEVQKVFAVPPK